MQPEKVVMQTVACTGQNFLTVNVDNGDAVNIDLRPANITQHN